MVTPTYPLLNLKALPEFRRLFERLLRAGSYHVQERVFRFSATGAMDAFGREEKTPTQVFFGHASDPDSLESATAKAVWCDEAGQKKFRYDSCEALNRRVSIHQGRILLTTTPYGLGWLKQRLWDPWEQSGQRHPDIDVIRFDSTENPAFPRAEFERARATLPTWKFNLFYRAIFTRPAGLIYDCFDERRHKVPRFAIPASWERYLGLDFGGVNTAGVFFAAEPGTGRLYAYREYKAGSRTAAEHVAALLAGELGIPTCVGGAKSEGQWRAEFAAAGLPVREPKITEVEVGIDRVYGAHRRNEILVFEDLAGYLDQKLSYSRALDDRGEPTEKIEDKDTFHYMDAERYIIGWLKDWLGEATITAGGASVVQAVPSGVFGRSAGEERGLEGRLRAGGGGLVFPDF